MDPATARALLDLNRRFYQRHAASFSRSRQRPWPGWRRVLALVDGRPAPLRVLDAGCGNGRFADFLARTWPGEVDYLGVDACPQLLAHARPPAGDGRWRFEHLDLMGDDVERRLAGRRFELVVLFGLLHHLPGFQCRRDLLLRLGRVLAPAGRLVATVWRLDADPRFRRRRLPWRRHNAGAATPIDPAALEPGDHLLTWNGDAGAPRYCHAASDAELDRLLATLPLETISRFHADGGRNAYLVLARRRDRRAATPRNR